MNPTIKKRLFTLGFPLSPLYSQVMSFRALLYRKKIFKTHRLTVPVISVGNLTMGGTGKTPLVMQLAANLFNEGYRPAIVSRGYRGKSKKKVNIVSDGFSVLMTAEQCGDEPWHLARELPGVIVSTGKNRVLPCNEVIQRFNCDIIILDDGFQHLQIARSIDLVLFDIDTFAGNSRVFPGGDLREPVSALKRCDAFVLTGQNRSNVERAQNCTAILNQRFPDKPLFSFGHSYRMAHKYYYKAGIVRESLPLDTLPPDLYCFCGIANPLRFKHSLEKHNISLSEFKTFQDHRLYTEQDVSQLFQMAREHHSSGLLTTEKDISKLQNVSDFELPIYTLPLHFNENQNFNEFIHKILINK